MRGFNPFICQVCGDYTNGPWGIYHGMMCCEDCGRKRDEMFSIQKQDVHEQANTQRRETKNHK